MRYVAIELGIGGHQPHPAPDIFSHRYGDCKDSVTLLSTRLREVGIDSYYVLINTGRGAVSESTPPNLHFNHAIIAIVLPDPIGPLPRPDLSRQVGEAAVLRPNRQSDPDWITARGDASKL